MIDRIARARASRCAAFLLACSPFASNAAGSGTWTVTSTADTNDHVCDTDCTLREALEAAQPDDTITFSTLFLNPQTIGIGSTLTIDKKLRSPATARTC